MPAKIFRIESGQKKIIESPFEHDMASSIQDDLNVGYLDMNIQNLIGSPQNFEKTDYNFDHKNLTFNLYFFNDIINPETAEFLKFINNSDWTNAYYTKLKEKNDKYKTTTASNIKMPSFYNSFSYLYSDVKNVYKNNFTRQSFFYDSFIRIDFYTTPDLHTRKRVFTKLIYNNKRYLGTELGFNSEIQPSPQYILDQECDGFVINWLSVSPITDLYAVFSYYNAFPEPGRETANRISLVPSPRGQVIKNKWVVDTSYMNPEEFYVKYSLNTTSKSYSINLYDPTTLDFTITTDLIDLFEFKNDAYWAKHNGYIDIVKDSVTKKSSVLDTANSFKFSNSIVNVFGYHGTSNAEYAIPPGEPLEENVVDYPIDIITVSQKLTNTGETTLKLLDIIVTDNVTNNDPLSTPGFHPNIIYTEKIADKNFSQNVYMYFDNAHTAYANDTSGYITRMELTPPYKENLVTGVNATKDIYKKQLGTRLGIVYGQNLNYLLERGKQIDISFNLTVGGKVARAFIAHVYKNTLFFDKLLVTFRMQNVNDHQIIEESFLIDFRLVISRSTKQDRGSYTQSEVNTIWYDNYSTYVTKICYDKGYYVGTNLDGSLNYTQNNLNNALFNYINKPEIKDSDATCSLSDPQTLTHYDYASNNAYDNYGNPRYVSTYDEFGNETVTQNPNYQG